jgi:ubiquinone/menaquinone biosynthesis C-methylase UbiE
MTDKYDRKKVEMEFDDMGEDSSIVHWDANREDIITTVGKRAMDLLDLKEKDIVLDMGTGRGRWTLEISQKCKMVLGIDISNNLLLSAKKIVESRGIENISYFRGSFENPFEETDLRKYGINKIIAIYAMHHLTDPMKKQAVGNMLKILQRPEIIVIGDLMWSEPPENHREKWDEVYYDEGDSDFPSSVEYLKNVFVSSGAEVKYIKIHPLVGIIKAKFV